MLTIQNSNPVFNFGSNSTAQLRARLNNSSITTRRATVRGWSRIFHKYTHKWAGSSASIVPSSGTLVHGTLAILSDEEKSKLDDFEAGCDEVTVSATVYGTDGGTTTVDAVAYVVRVSEGHQGIAQPYPSEQYLCAVAGMLREHWPPEIASYISINTIRDGKVFTRGTWTHPYALGQAVESLQALAVEINLELNKPWVMPRAARAFEAAITNQMGINYAYELMNMFVHEGCSKLAEKLRIDGCIDFEIDEEDLSQALEKVSEATDRKA